ncbi:MAG: hypothetical protein MUF34_28360 [Polyangiaceae bacterium]|jgi:hypothetical protein|nr:hypothetical protein [Polyangiaceae bacterium]
MRLARRSCGFGASALGAMFALGAVACEIEGTPSGVGGAAGSGGAAGAGGVPRLPPTVELRARWGDGGVREASFQEGTSTRRTFTREGVGQGISFTPTEAARAMGTGAVELGLYNLPFYAFARPAAGSCQARADISYQNSILTYKLSADEQATGGPCSSFMGSTTNGAEIVFQNVPVGVYSTEVEAPATVTVRVIFSP